MQSLANPDGQAAPTSAAHPCWGSSGQGPPLGAEDTCQFLRHLAGRPAPARSRGGGGDTLSAGVKFRTAQPSQQGGNAAGGVWGGPCSHLRPGP